MVSYNKLLCNIFKAHINVNNCNSNNSIKYLCKYINFIYFDFPIHELFPIVVQLDCHLENGQRIYVDKKNLVEN